MQPATGLRGVLTVACAMLAIVSEPVAASREWRPGDFAWYGDEAEGQGGDIAVVVNLPMQFAYVYRDGVLIGESTVSTGKPGKDTPPGDYTILQKRVFHRSNRYSNAPMPFMLRLTWSGIAMHGGDLPGYPASHGCIRFPKAFARQLFHMTEVGASVSVVGEPAP